MRPMSPLARRAAAIVVVILLLAGVAIVTARAMGVPLAIGPLASATIEPLPTPTSGGAGSAGPSASADPAATFAAIEGQVRAIRLLPAPDIGPADLLGRDQLQAELRLRLRRPVPAGAARRATTSRCGRSGCWPRGRTWRRFSSSCWATRCSASTTTRGSGWRSSRTPGSPRRRGSPMRTSTRTPCRTRPSVSASSRPMPWARTTATSRARASWRATPR